MTTTVQPRPTPDVTNQGAPLHLASRPAPRRRFGAIERTLLRRSLRERRRVVLGLAAAAFLMALLVVSLYSSVGVRFDDAFEAMPPALESMFDGANFGTPEGFVQVELFSFVGPGLAIAAGIAAGSNTIAGAERSGRLTLIINGPVRRRSVVTAAIATTLLSVTAVSLALLIGILAGAMLGGVTISASLVAAACFSLGLLGVAVGMIALATGAMTGNKPAATAVATAVALASYAIYTFFPLDDRLEPLQSVSLWYPFAANRPLINGIEGTHAAVLAAVAVVAALSAYWGFERRDLRT